MDPNTVLRDILEDLSREDREEHRDEVMENLATLTDWLLAGGFLPTVERIGQSYKVKR